jgi:hypothetical protein
MQTGERDGAEMPLGQVVAFAARGARRSMEGVCASGIVI